MQTEGDRFSQEGFSIFEVSEFDRCSGFGIALDALTLLRPDIARMSGQQLEICVKRLAELKK